MGDAFNPTAGLTAQDWQRSQEQKAMSNLQGSAPGDRKRISESARAFESLLITKWLEAAEESLATVPGGGEEADESVKQYSGLAVQALGTCLSGAGGIGIAPMIERALEKQQVSIDSKGLK